MFTTYGVEETVPGYPAYKTNYLGIWVECEPDGSIWLTIPTWDVEVLLDHVPSDEEIDRFKARYVD